VMIVLHHQQHVVSLSLLWTLQIWLVIPSVAFTPHELLCGVTPNGVSQFPCAPPHELPPTLYVLVLCWIDLCLIVCRFLLLFVVLHGGALLLLCEEQYVL
jgi:hypothetical protein